MCTNMTEGYQFLELLLRLAFDPLLNVTFDAGLSLTCVPNGVAC